MKTADGLEILSADLLEHKAQIVNSFREQAKRFDIHLGWHYELDLAWIGSQLKGASAMRILDAGGGTGVLQWWLAEQGAHVVSVDRLDRSDLSGRFRLAYKVDGLRPIDLIPTRAVMRTRFSQRDQSVGFRLKGSLRAAATAFLEPLRTKSPGRVTLYQQGLDNLVDLEDSSFDTIVSVSALEHNKVEDLPNIVRELLRVLKPGGIFLATMAAARDDDWYHEPSRGWCLAENSLREIFALPADSQSNFSEYDSLLHQMHENESVRSRLDPVFSKSGNSGMPWGIWDPQYLPVGVRKRKE